MHPTLSRNQYRSWVNGAYFISTDPSLIPIDALNAAFASEEMYWTDPLPEEVMREMLQNSLCFGLYESGPKRNFVGIARCVTDFVTFLYVTDVYVDNAYQGKGLGTWLVSCVQEVVESMPHLRRTMLLTGDWKRSVPFYEKIMGMKVHENKIGQDGETREGLAVLMCVGKAATVAMRG